MSIEEDIEPGGACPFCGRTDGQVRAGYGGGRRRRQRHKCGACGRRYTAEAQERGYPAELREQALRLSAEGAGVRVIARTLGVNHQTAANWIKAVAGVGGGDDSGAAPPEAHVGPPLIASPRIAASEEKQRRATIHDVAVMAGVSNSTVSNYLNHKGHMSATTRQRVETAMDSLHFTPSALVRAIRRRQTRIIGVLLFGLNTLDVDVGKSITPPLLAGINEAAEEAEYDVLLYPGFLYRPRRHPGLPFLNGQIDGLLWVAPKFDEPILQRVADAGLPVVALLTRHVPNRAGYVNADNLDATRRIVAHLVEAGHRRIARAGAAHSSNDRDRHDAYRQAVASHGLPFRPDWDVVVDDPDAPPEVYSAIYGTILDRWLAQPEPPTAIVLPSDGAASIMIDEVRRRGRRVPEDLAITGFDDVPDAMQIGGGLTTVRQPFRRIGITAVERIVAMIEGAPVDSCRVTLPAEMIVRRTTGGGAITGGGAD
jgi:LacI family transcriptional regulator